MVEFPPSYCPTCGTALDPEDEPRYECTECSRTVFHSPTIATQVAVIDSDADGISNTHTDTEPQILLGERKNPPGKGRYTTPGGHIDIWEEPKTTAVRELQEETGLRAAAEDLKLLEVRDLTATVPVPGLTDQKQVICVDYWISSQAVDGQPAPADDLAALTWAGTDDLDEIQWAYEQDPLICRQAFRAFETTAEP